MKRRELDVHTQDRRDEYLALINMLGYAQGIARTLGAASAATHVDSARQTLVAALQTEFPSNISDDGVKRLAAATLGHC
ncbi:hypothetical protein ACQKGC_08525 [Allorhizobium pseudoryzae]|uniref:hypothetical protein n=1 Tax=Allorhizobium pseudoryzae TaxID=379684 RepID=UPI0013EB543E|nr:hypothetical protein [Allorhizobium pseudoryzae]